MTPAPGTALYAKAKQRMLNRLGKKTSLTRNPRVDHISPRLDEVSRARRDAAALLRQFRASYRKTLHASTQLGIHLVALWSAEVGERAYVPEIDSFVREKSPQQLLVAQEAADDIRTVMEQLEKLSARFDAYLQEEAAAPFRENDEGQISRKDDVVEAKEWYKVARTKYSDAMINFKQGSCTAQELDAVRMDYEACTTDLESKMASYEQLWREHLFTGISTFFDVQLRYVEQVSDTLADLQPWTSHVSLDLAEMKQLAGKKREQRQLASDLRAKADSSVRTATAAPILAEKVPQPHPHASEVLTPLPSGSTEHATSDDGIGQSHPHSGTKTTEEESGRLSPPTKDTAVRKTGASVQASLISSNLSR